MGGQLVFDWDRLENFLITRDRPVRNTVTNTKMPKLSIICANAVYHRLSKWCTSTGRRQSVCYT